MYSNLRGDVPEKIKICYEDLKHLNPAVVCCSLTGFGMSGPLKHEPGYDYILQGVAGWTDVIGEPDGPPTKSGLSLVDYSGGFVAAIAILCALHSARRDGVGSDCDISLFDTAISMLTYSATWSLNGDFEPRRTCHSAHPSLVPFQAFEALDRWIVVACPKEKFWRRLCEAIGRDDIVDDPRFDSFQARYANADELVGILDRVFRGHTAADWLERLKAAGVPCGPVNSVEEALEGPQAKVRNMVIVTSHPRFGEVKQFASPVKVGAGPVDYKRAPFLNEDAHYILADLLGYSLEQIEILEDTGEAECPT